MVSDAPGETIDASAPSKGNELAERSTLGKYKLERVLGKGGMGVVWAAHDPDLERSVALKVLRYENASTELRTRLLREARAMARLKHQNVLTVYEVGSEGERDFIAMELVEGASLDAWLATKPPREEIWQALIAAGHGLAAAHRGGLVHRDFKPQNVLRDQNGRVLVTDFGLARGHGSAQAAVPTDLPTPLGLEVTLDAAAATTTPSSLDVPLTQTGALLGTPAYMAPEQYLGAPSDPRTDQFAYCVTAWQLLSGERPFRGTTVDDLRRAARAGVANVKAKLPAAIRGVLARGLDPEAANRWPDMQALLAALERAKSRPRRLVRFGFAIAIAALGVALAVKLSGTPSPAPKPEIASAMCSSSPEVEMAKAWTPGMRAKWSGGDPGFDRVADELDGFAKRWIEDYRQACAGDPRSPKTLAKLGCLLGERDQVVDKVELGRTMPANVIHDVDMGGVLPRTEACDGDAPVTPPSPPDDPARVARIHALRKQLIRSSFDPVAQVLAGMPALIAEAEAIGWEPIVAEAHHAYAIAAQRAPGLWELARDQYKIANVIAHRTRHYHLEAETWIGLLESELDAASDPTTDRNFNDLIAQAKLAAGNAGNDPVFLARIEHVEGDFAHARGKLDEAITKYDEARASELAAHDVASAMRFAISGAETLLQRNAPDDLDRAWQRLEEIERAATAAKLSRDTRARLDEIMVLVAELRGDLPAAHAAVDRLGRQKPIEGGAAITGHVVDTEGKPVADASVAAWAGEMLGDATRAHLRYGTVSVASTDADGKFIVFATPNSGIIAERDERRSRPQLAGTGPTLVLEPTRTVTGTVASDGSLAGVVIMARFKAGRDTVWKVGGRVARDHGYKLVGMPPGDYVLALDSIADPNKPTRKLESPSNATPRWPVGPTIDAIVHKASEATQIWVLRGRRTAKTRADMDRMFEAASEGQLHPALIVGVGDQTVEAMPHYALGDHHARFLENAKGELSVCVAGDAPTSPAMCKTITLRGDETVVPVEFP